VEESAKQLKSAEQCSQYLILLQNRMPQLGCGSKKLNLFSPYGNIDF